MNNVHHFIILLLMLLCSCRHTSPEDDSLWCDKVISNKCFEEDRGLFQGTSIGNNVIEMTPMGNFLKYTAINDSEVVFSCGRDHKEISLYTFSCSEPNRYPSLYYEREGVIILITPAGTNVWNNDFITLYDNSVYHAQAYYIDTTLLRYVELSHVDDKVYFKITDIPGKRSDTVLSNYYKIRADGDPSLHIGEVSLSSDTLFYSVEYGNGMKRDTLYF